jgi:molybdopterin-binding protein
MVAVITSAVSKEEGMAISARNQLQGTVKSVTLGAVMAEVVIDVGGQEVVSAITRHSVERLGIKEGDSVTAVIKATEVMVMK